MLYFFSVHLRIHPKPAFVVDIGAHIETKLRALACYHSQFVQGRATPTAMIDQLRERARYWGWAIGSDYGEPLASREELGLRGLRDVV
jgi:LmbE family N-acetylglucosaminyl deacetylase